MANGQLGYIREKTQEGWEHTLKEFVMGGQKSPGQERRGAATSKKGSCPTAKKVLRISWETKRRVILQHQKRRLVKSQPRDPPLIMKKEGFPQAEKN